ncbi:Glutathione synthase/RimK-type ligase, ATP-grasp superfamily [Massilia sp. PDC64]|nr:RimK family alpha-L-glutamate ligase [Massilia sp. PDC64]SDE47893.1 Glutathione synthase/RimK-type ligase, ATP-grasp superfamily [Massilia sp. PDC64]
MTTTGLLDAAAMPYAPLIGAAVLMRCAFERADLRPVGERLLARASAHPDDANAWLDASFVLQLLGQRAAGLEVQRHALAIRTLYALPAPARMPTMRLLVLMGPGDFMANTPIEFLLQASGIAAQVQYVTPDQPLPDEVPDHDVLFVAIAQSDANAPLLRDVAQMLEGWPRPVINRPERIAHLSRDGFCATLDGVPGMLVPRTVRMDREAAMQLTDSAFPLIVRPVDSHAGTDLQKVDDAAALRDYLAAHPAGAFYLAPFVDYSGPDGQFRKYRIVLVDGKPFICHLAISSHWMVHYLNAGMDDSAAKRAEEAAGMAGFDEGFARRHAAALAQIDARIGLPWLGIDCAETRDGRLLIFEVDNAMVVHAMDDPVRYPYKGPAMAKVFTAFERMLQSRRD